MKRSILTILFLASLSALAACGSDATTSPGGTQPGGAGTSNGTAGSGNAGTSPGTAGSSNPGGGDTSQGGANPGGGGASGAAGSPITSAGTGGVDTLPMGGTSGNITGTLTAANSTWGPQPVTLTGPVTIPAGVTLTIQRGTSVSGAFPITAAGGVFNCAGSLAFPITLFNTSVVLTGGAHTIQYCIVNTPMATPAIDVNGAQLTATHLQLQNFLTTGVHVHGAGAKVTINFSTLGSRGNLFTGDTVGQEGVAVLIDADAAMDTNSITNSVLGFLNDATNTGLKIAGASNTHLAYDNITGTQSVYATSDTPVGILTKAPGIADIPNLDHNLAFFSPDLDQADPAADFSQEPAPNGGRANLGYYGGTAQARITTVELVSPNGCVRSEAGPGTVTWLSSPNTGAKTLELSTDGGTNWAPLAKVAVGADTGSMQVTYPSIMTDQAKVRFSQDNDPTHIMDVSERPFSIGMPINAAACANLKPACTGDCRPFKAICYTGYRDGQMPTGAPGPNEPTLAQVTQDLTILSTYTHGIRTYGSNPLLHDGGSVPGVADSLNLDLHMGIWIDDSYTDDVNMKALNDSIGIVAANHKSIKTLIISNEYLLRVRQNKKDTVAAEARLVGYLKYVRSKVPTTIPVVIGESYPDWLNASKALYDAVDIVMWHVHPWWQGSAIGAAGLAAQTAHEAVLAKMKGYGITKEERLAETGFPWGETTGAAVGSEANQEQYLSEINAYSMKVNLQFYFFEGFDEAWKSAEGAVGGKWGIFTAARTPHKVMTDIATVVPAANGWPN